MSTIIQREFSIEQVIAGKSALEWYSETYTRYVLLVAQMQSGKTTVYYFVAAEMLRLGKISNIVIFSGNSEKELRDQVTNSASDKFYRMYARYLRSLEWNEDRIEDLIVQIKSNLIVKWGAHPLSKRSGNYTRTLFIWDESHYAQDFSMKPSEFLTKNSIPVNGDSDTLEGNDNYFLSVSATPFSEISDIQHLHQLKGVVRLEPGVGYHSVETMLTSNKIVPFTVWTDALDDEMRTATYANKYALVRVKNQDPAIEIATRNGWDVMFYDSAVKDNTRNKVVSLQTQLNSAPRKNTIILLKGMCRMGKEVEKTHLAFVMETFRNSKTDVILQGLLGRTCGYHSYTDIRVFLHENILEPDESGMSGLDKYVAFTHRENVIPSNGKNLAPLAAERNRSGLSPIIPVKISKRDLRIDGSDDIAPKREHREFIIESVRAAFRNGRFASGNFNCPEQTAELVEQIDDVSVKVNVHILSKSGAKITPKTYENVPAKLNELISSRTAGSLGSSTGPVGTIEVNVWWLKSAFTEYGFSAGDVFIDARTHAFNPDLAEKREVEKRIPITNGKEVFCRPLVEESVEDCRNGSYAMELSIETSTCVDAMRSAVVDIIRISLIPTEHVDKPTQIVSNQPAGSKWPGILVCNDVIVALNKRGAIYDHIKSKYGVAIRISKKKGARSKELTNAGMIQLTEISW